MKRRLMAFLLAMVGAAVLLANPLPSMAEVWKDLGLYGGQVYDIAIDPVNPGKMFAGIYMGGGLYLSEDEGNTWQAVDARGQIPGEDEFKDHAVWAVKIAPSNNNVIWVAHNYWVEKSTDGGQTWTHIFNRDMQRDCTGCGGSGDDFRFCMTLAVDPSDAQTVYVGTSGTNGAFGSPGAIYKTKDGGASWTKINQGNDFDYTIADIDIDPQDNNIIWAVTSSWGVGGYAGTLCRSEDGGETWTNIHTVASGRVTVAVKPNDSNTVFTGGGAGLEKHYFDGNEWQYIWPVIPDDYPNFGCRQTRDITFDPQNPETLYVPWRNPWFGDYLPRISRSTNGGIDWETTIVGYEFKCLEVHPTNSEVLMGGDLYLGMYKSQDHGQSWTPVNDGLNGVIVYDIQNDPNDSSHMLAGTLSGLFEKRSGEDWTQILPYVIEPVQFDPADSLTFYAGLNIGYVAKTSDGGLTWTYRYLGAAVKDISVDPSQTNTLYVATAVKTDPGKIWKSGDGGDSYSEILVGENLLGEVYDFNVVTIDPSDSQHIFAGGGNFYAPKVLGDLWESTDGGINWYRNPLNLKDVIVNDVLVDPTNPDIMYAGCGYSGGTLVPLYKSTDGGVTWTESFEGIPDIVISLPGVWGSSGSDVFAVGGGHIVPYNILHYDGSAWTEMESGTSEILNNVWGSSGSDVFAVGNYGTILHYDGSIWAPMESGTTEHLYGVWGICGTNVFVVGYNGTILHYNGSNWSSVESGTSVYLYGIWGTSRNNIFAVGDDGTILHYNGCTWSSMESGTSELLEGIWGTSGEKILTGGRDCVNLDVFAVGREGTILHYDGYAWSPMESGTTKWLHGIWGSSVTDVFAVGNLGTILHYDGSTWSDMAQDSKDEYRSVWGSSGSDVFVSGTYGSILHYDGNAWSTMRPEGSVDNAVTDLEFHPQENNVIYTATFGAGVYLSPNQAGGWLNLGIPEYKVFAISTGSLYAATQGGVYQCTGTGVIAGDVTDDYDQSGIDGATVLNDLGPETISVNGEYMMVSPSGICVLTAIADGYEDEIIGGVTVHGGNITWADIAMQRTGMLNELAVDFGTFGLWHYDGIAWNRINGADSEWLLAYDDRLAVDFGSIYGLFDYDGITWNQLSPWDPDNGGNTMVAYDNGLAVDFGGNGLWSYDGATWNPLADWNPDSMKVWDSGLAVDFSTFGLWNYDGSSWTRLAGWNPDNTEAWDSRLAVDFGIYGLWNYDGSSWISLAGWDPDNMEAWNDGLAVDFGSYGLWYYDGSSWTSLAGWDPDSMEPWGAGLAVDFGIYGLWNYDGSSWISLAGWDPDDMVGLDDDLAVDFGAYGLWYYDGSSWINLAGWDPQDMSDVNLY
jgi:photosystem II stability/assembly factor-like uncharacterized protein